MTFAEGSQLQEFGDYAFYETGITEVQIPASVQTIGEGAFSGCESLQRVTFAEGSQLREIGKDAFYETGTAEVQIPASVQTIG